MGEFLISQFVIQSFPGLFYNKMFDHRDDFLISTRPSVYVVWKYHYGIESSSYIDQQTLRYFGFKAVNTGIRSERGRGGIEVKNPLQVVP